MLKLFSALATAEFRSFSNGSQAAFGVCLSIATGHLCVFAADQIQDNLHFSRCNTGVFQISPCFHVNPPFGLLSVIRFLGTGVAFIRSGGGKLTEFVTDHIFRYIDRNVFASVMYGKCVTHEIREDSGCAAPGFENLLLACFVHFLNSS